MKKTIPNFKKIKTNKLSVVFTWDDNYKRHYDIIAKLFIKNEFRCTFYVNPGLKSFSEQLQTSYRWLQNNGFEIGSHGLTHQHMTKLNEKEALAKIIESKLLIGKYLGITPFTFAFPHHDFNLNLLELVRTHFLEARNNLRNSQRISIKTNSKAISLIQEFEYAIKRNLNVVFSGHSAITNREILNNLEGEGYEPVRELELDSLLQKIQKSEGNFEIITFIQAAIKEQIKSINSEQDAERILSKLNNIGITQKILKELI